MSQVKRLLQETPLHESIIEAIEDDVRLILWRICKDQPESIIENTINDIIASIQDRIC